MELGGLSNSILKNSTIDNQKSSISVMLHLCNSSYEEKINLLLDFKNSLYFDNIVFKT
jgi:hypothetical protein